MKSKVLEKLFELNRNVSELSQEDQALLKMLKEISSNRNFYILERVLNNVHEDFFIKDQFHGISHNERVTILGFYLAIKEGINDPNDLEVLLNACLYHDIGRKVVSGKEHGRMSSEIITQNRTTLFPSLNDNSVNQIKLLCTIHNIDNNYSELINEYNVTDSSSLRKLVNIIKDADALDRVRLRRFGQLDPDLLRTNTAKETVDLSKKLFRDYSDIQYELGVSFNTELFEIDNFMPIEDEDNYYIFRSLNVSNIEDIENPEQSTIRNKASITKDQGIKSKYSDRTTPNLEEVYSSIRVARSGKETNCISFTSNPAVSLDYSTSRYIMIPIPKNGVQDPKILSAGKFMLEEINKKISAALRNQNIDSDIENIISQIDSEQTLEGLAELLSQSMEHLTIRKEHKRYFNNGEKLSNKTPVSTRFRKKDYLTDSQELEYSKVVAKLTVLELTGYLKSILPTQKDNALLLRTLGGAFSSSEYIYYGDIPKEKAIQVSSDNIKALSLIKQAKSDSSIDKEGLSLLERYILSNPTRELIQNETREQSNNDSKSNLSIVDSIDLLHSDTDNSVIPYYKGHIAIEYARNYAKARLDTLDILESLEENLKSSNVSQNILDTIQSLKNNPSYIIPNSSIISRRNGQGLQLSDSVKLDMNPNSDIEIFDTYEQIRFITALNLLSIDELKQISNGNYDSLKANNTFIRSLKSDSELGSRNEYFINYIIDSIALDRIYSRNTIRRERTEELRKKLFEELNKHDIDRLFNSFYNIGISQDEIPNYILNLLIYNGYGDKESLDDLINTPDLEGFLRESFPNLKNKISTYSLEKFLEIHEDGYKIEDTNLTLREYQKFAKDRLDEIYESKKFAGVVLPTGAGKSFVTMAKMLDYRNKEIVYFAPQQEILNQVQKHILKHILNKTIINPKDVDKIASMSRQERNEFLKDKVFNRDLDIDKMISLYSKASSEEEKESIRIQFLPRRTAQHDDIMDVINSVDGFPNLKMYCYQSLNGSEFENLIKQKIDFMVLDELHRAGAETWAPQIDNIINTHKDAKILGITATPIRDTPMRSVNGEVSSDMMLYMAKKYGDYTQEELDSKDYLATEMYLADAIKSRYVVEPKIVPFNFTLAYSDEYQFVSDSLRESRKQNPNSETTLKLQKIKQQMDSIIGTSSISKDKKLKQQHIKEIARVIEQNFPDNFKNGRMIVFLGQNDQTTNITTEEYVQNQIELIHQYFEGVNKNIHSDYLLSQRKDKNGNANALADFENLDTDELKLLFAINMLNEGVHVDNVNGELMLREIGEGTNILYFQQIGRVIYSIDPEHPPRDEDRPIIFDVYNNFLARNLEKTANRSTPTSDLLRLLIIKKWMYENGIEMPDINSEDIEEARKAIFLKKIQQKYEKYIDGIGNSNLSKTEVIEIEKILEVASDINLFEMNFPERIIPPNERDIDYVKMFDVQGETKDFLDLFKEANKEVRKAQISDKSNNRLRLKTIMGVLQTLSDYGVDLTDTNFINQYVSNHKEEIIDNNEEDSARKNLTLYELIENGFTDGTLNSLIDDLNMDIDELKEYKIYEEFCFARDLFKSKKKTERDLFNIYNLIDVRKSGILSHSPSTTLDNVQYVNQDDEHKQKYNKYNNGFNVSRGFITEKGPSVFIFKNIYTGTNYDEEDYDYFGYNSEGYDRDNYDRLGYDKLSFKRGETINKYGFYRNGINKDTGTPYNIDGFDIYKIHNVTHDYYDPHGFNIDHLHKDTKSKLNPDGYSYNGFYYRNGLFTGSLYNENGKDFDGWDIFGYDENGVCHFDKPIDNRGFNQKGVNIHTKTLVDEAGLNVDGLFMTFEGERVIKTSLKYGTDGFDKDGINQRFFNRAGINIKTNSFLDENGFDKDGYYWDLDEKTGEYINTNSKYDFDGIDCNGIDRHGFNKDQKYMKKVTLVNGMVYYEKTNSIYNNYGFKANLEHKNGTLFDNYGFDIDGIHKDTEDIVDTRHFNRDKIYCIKDENDNWVSTGKKLDDLGFDINKNYHGIPDKKYDNEGYDWQGLNKHRFNRNHMYVDENGNQSVVNPHGFGYDGHIYEYYEPTKTYHKTNRLYDDEGYDIDNYDRCKFDRNHMYLGKSAYDPYGFDYKHINKDTNSKYDLRDFDYLGIHKITHKVYNERFFDRDGFFYEKNSKGEYVKTNKKYDDKGFTIDFTYKNTSYTTNEFGVDANDVFHEELVRDPKMKAQIKATKERAKKEKEAQKKQEIEKQKLDRKMRQTEKKTQEEERKSALEEFKSKFDDKGFYSGTNLPYNEYLFTSNGTHYITGLFQDVRGFNFRGECLRNNYLPYDRNGFKQDGTHKDTGELYYKGYNAFGLNKDGYNKYGKKPFELKIAEEFFNNLSNAKSMDEFKKMRVETYREVMQKQHVAKFNKNDMNLILYTATLMYPPLKEQLLQYLKNQNGTYLKLKWKYNRMKDKANASEKELQDLKDQYTLAYNKATNLDFMNKPKIEKGDK